MNADTFWITSTAILFVSLVTALAGVRPLPRGGRHCRHCGYDLTATPDEHRRCSECGRSLIGSVDESPASPAQIRRRHFCRRWGFLGIATACVMLVVTLALDLRRLPFTPTDWLVSVDVPIAIRLSDDLSAPVFQEVDRRRCAGSLPLERLQTISQGVLDRLDEPRHGGATGRKLLVEGWGAGLVADEDFFAIPSLWPTITLTPERSSTHEMNFRLDLKGDLQVDRYQSILAARAAPLRLEVRVASRSLSNYEAPFPVRTRTDTPWPPNQAFGNDRDVTWRADGVAFPLGAQELSVTVEIALIERGGTRRSESRRHELSTPIEILQVPPPEVRADVADCEAIAADLEAHSRLQVGSDGFTTTLTLGMARHHPAILGTPRIELESDVDGESRTVLIDLDHLNQSGGVLHYPSIEEQRRTTARNREGDPSKNGFLRGYRIPEFHGLSEGTRITLRFDSNDLDLFKWAGRVDRSARFGEPGIAIPPELSVVRPCRFEIEIPVLKSHD
ncbi:MAG: hypothetical protein CMJ51_04885 [Planctomycetaceae bacterium]|nr:hypothetical protein [Planctomycetaceae bacterium]